MKKGLREKVLDRVFRWNYLQVVVGYTVLVSIPLGFWINLRWVSASDWFRMLSAVPLDILWFSTFLPSRLLIVWIGIGRGLKPIGQANQLEKTFLLVYLLSELVFLTFAFSLNDAILNNLLLIGHFIVWLVIAGVVRVIENKRRRIRL